MNDETNLALFCDTHCHLDMPAFSEDFDAVLHRAIASGLEFVIIPALDCGTAENALALAHQHPGFFYTAVGIHPNYAAEVDPTCLNELAFLAAQPGVVAIGEIGLDYHWDYATPAQQKAVLLPQLELASEVNLPVIIHNRDAGDDLGEILLGWHASLPTSHALKDRPGVMHSYTGSAELADKLAQVGFYFGIGGPVTYKNGKDKQDLAAMLPREKILLETDSPYLPPHPHRGERNEPAYIPLIAEKVGEIWGMSARDVGRVTTANARRLFGIP